MNVAKIITALLLSVAVLATQVGYAQADPIPQVVVYVCYDMDDNQDCQEYETPVPSFTLYYRSDGNEWRLRSVEGVDGFATIPFLNVFREADIYVAPRGGLPSHTLSLDVNWHDHIIYGPTEVTIAYAPELYLPIVR